MYFRFLSALIIWFQNILFDFLQGIGLFIIVRLEEVTTCTRQSRNTIWERTVMYAGTIYFNALPACIMSAPLLE